MRPTFSIREWFRLLATLLVIAACCLGCQSGPSAKRATVFRVMTYNIHHGEGLEGRVDLERIADLIRRERADLVALQEVDKGTERTGRRDLGAELAALTGLACVFSNNYSFQGGEYGNAILTRFPVKQVANTHYRKVNETEQRGLLQATLDIGGREVIFLVTHIDHRADDSARWSNVAEIESLVASWRGRPVLLAGDFNDQPDSRVARRLSEIWLDTWPCAGEGAGFTIPADKPNRRIDFIWFLPSPDLVPLRAWVPVSEASDHRPVVAEFRLGRSD